MRLNVGLATLGPPYKRPILRHRSRLFDKLSGLLRPSRELDSMAMIARFPPMRWLALAAGLGMVVALASPASAQQPGDKAQQPADKDWAQPPKELPRAERGEPTYNLDTLFAALKIAPDEASAKAIEQRIWALWMNSGSDTCTLLMTRVKVATDAKDYDLALKLLNAIVEINPDYVEAWNQRATIHYLKHDFGHAIADLREVLVREPRHFGALSGLGMMLQEIGDDKDALTVYRKALAIDPHLEHIPEVVKTLAEKVEGREI
jgi:tetratricopeptide (TPR) repeat protein